MIVLGLTLVLSALLCGLYLRLARRLQILDMPNERSSHQRPTPHGGGTPMMMALTLGFFAASYFQGGFPEFYMGLLLGALLLCALGVLDDIHELPASLRFVVYTLVCGYLLLAYLPTVLPLLPQVLFVLVLLISWLWLINLYNFMDGIDGIAGTQCLLAAGGAALLSSGLWGGIGNYAYFCLLLAASQLGFLLWNWPPARLFMGDAGSIPTGMLAGGLALIGQVTGSLPGICWMIMLAVFITDATLTLLRRILRGERFLEAHRTHASQRLSRHWGSHLRVDLLLIAINLLWLFPLAALVAFWPEWQFILVILAYLPLLCGMAILRKLA